MSKITFLLDAGHGGIVNGKYTTAPNFDKNNKSTWKKVGIIRKKIFYSTKEFSTDK